MRQAEAIRRWRPWVHSTGPRTPEGKARSQRNGSQPGTRSLLREVTRLLSQQSKALAELKG
jgi:hypothetical protein